MTSTTTNPRGTKLDGSKRKCRACGETGHNTRTCATLGRSKKMSVKSLGVGRGRGNRHCSKCGSTKHNARTCGTKKTNTKRGKDGRFTKSIVRRNSSKRRMRRNSMVSATKGYRNWFTGEMSSNAHGAQKWGSQKITQKAVTTVGGVAGYIDGGYFTQIGQGMSDNALIGSGVGIATGVAGTTLSSWVVNKVLGEMVFKGHESKNHTFANFTKGWRTGGYIAVGLNTITNLLTMTYGRSYNDLGSWNSLMNEASHAPMSAIKKMCMKSAGADKLAHLPVFAGLGQGMYNAGPNAPLQGANPSPVGYVDVLGYPADFAEMNL